VVCVVVVVVVVAVVIVVILSQIVKHIFIFGAQNDVNF
jgi:hypothetical protein